MNAIAAQNDKADVLKRIEAYKLREIADAKAAVPEAEMRARASAALPARDFLAALRQTVVEGRTALIAEIKKASPSKG